MPDNEYIALSKLRLERAKECLSESKTLLEAEMCKASANRSYYAVFHALRAVLSLDGFDSKKHSGIISEFRKRYIKTEIFDSEISKMIGSLFDVRSHSDCDDFYLPSKEDAIVQLQNAIQIVSVIELYLNQKYR